VSPYSNTHDNNYGAIIMGQSLQEFTQVIWRMQTNGRCLPTFGPISLSHRSACRQLYPPWLSITTQLESRYVLPSHEGFLSWLRWLLTYRDGLPIHRVTHPTSNQARHTVTLLIETNTLPLMPNCHPRLGLHSEFSNATEIFKRQTITNNTNSIAIN